jgi:predicted amidohydrolase
MPNLTLAVAQSLPHPGDLPASIAHHVALAIAATSAGATLVVFPELSLTGYDLALTARDALAPDDPRLAPLQDVANSSRAILVVGAPVLSPAGLHIGALLFAPHQRVRSHFKVHLHDGEEVAFVPGLASGPFSLGPDVVSLAICADITHPQHAEAAADQGCTIYAAGCFLTPTGYRTDARRLRDAAARHGFTVLMANFGAPSSRWLAAGKSAVWKPGGTLLAQGPPVGAAVVLARRTGAGWQIRVLHAREPQASRGLTTA